MTDIDLPDDPAVSHTYAATGRPETITDGRGTTTYLPTAKTLSPDTATDI